MINPNNITRRGAMYKETIEQKFINNRLINAISARDFDKAKFYILDGANPNCRTQFGNTPLHIAAIVGDVDIAKFLLRMRGAWASVNDYGMTPLMVAENAKNEDVAKLLFKEEMIVMAYAGKLNVA